MEQRKRLSHDFLLLLSQPESIGSSKFLWLPPIIRGVLWGVDTRILKIQCFLAEIEAKENHARDVFAVPPFSYYITKMNFWLTRLMGKKMLWLVLFNKIYLLNTCVVPVVRIHLVLVVVEPVGDGQLRDLSSEDCSRSRCSCCVGTMIWYSYSLWLLDTDCPYCWWRKSLCSLLI